MEISLFYPRNKLGHTSGEQHCQFQTYNLIFVDKEVASLNSHSISKAGKKLIIDKHLDRAPSGIVFSHIGVFIRGSPFTANAAHLVTPVNAA
jgi:hypothetical protein